MGEREFLVGVALDNLPARVAIIDKSGVIVAVNRAWQEFAATDDGAARATEGVNYLRACEEATGDGAREAARFAEGIRSVLSGQRQEFTMNYPCRSPGERRWFVGWVARLLVGDARWAVITHEDITGRKLAEEELLRSETRNKAMLEAVPDLMFLISRDGEYLDFRARDEDELYVPPEEFVGRNLREIMPPELAGPMLDGIARALDTGETQLIEYSLPMPEGVLDFEARLVASGPEEILSVVRDVTRRKVAEREREQFLARERAAHQHLEAILDNLGEGVLVIGSGESVLFANPSAQVMLGMTDDSTPAELPDPCEGFSLRDAVDRCARTGEAIEARARCGRRFLQISLDRLVVLEENEVLVVLQDLSEGHRLEANQQRFLSNAAHQLKTPLTVILGAAELLASGGDEDSALRERLLNHISSEGRRMKRLSDVLLRLARVGWGEREPVIEPLNLAAAARYAAELVEPLVESAGLGIAVEGEGAYVYADSEWLREVLLVLLSNSIQHSGRGGFIQLIVRGATVTVEDVGVGISPDDLPHVFERFYRGRGNSEGFGIGLAICKELTERMGGSISIRSQEGVGTAIKVALPEVGKGVTNTPS
jgi:PAS domain S-box-containing protein